MAAPAALAVHDHALHRVQPAEQRDDRARPGPSPPGGGCGSRRSACRRRSGPLAATPPEGRGSARTGSSISTVPAPPWPKRKFSPTTTASAPTGGETSISAKRSARMRENALVKGTTSSSSTPRRSMSWVLKRDVGQHRGAQLGPQDGDRLGLEGQRHGAEPALAGDLDRPPDDGLVPDVDAVEGADGHHAPGPAEGQVAERLVAPHRASSSTSAGAQHARLVRPRRRPRGGRRGSAPPARSAPSASPRQRGRAAPSSGLASASSSRRGRCARAAAARRRPRGPTSSGGTAASTERLPTAVRRRAVQVGAAAQALADVARQPPHVGAGAAAHLDAAPRRRRGRRPAAARAIAISRSGSSASSPRRARR